MGLFGWFKDGFESNYLVIANGYDGNLSRRHAEERGACVAREKNGLCRGFMRVEVGRKSLT